MYGRRPAHIEVAEEIAAELAVKASMEHGGAQPFNSRTNVDASKPEFMLKVSGMVEWCTRSMLRPKARWFEPRCIMQILCDEYVRAMTINDAGDLLLLQFDNHAELVLIETIVCSRQWGKIVHFRRTTRARRSRTRCTR